MNDEEQLIETFRNLGLSESGARIAARGRHPSGTNAEPELPPMRLHNGGVDWKLHEARQRRRRGSAASTSRRAREEATASDEQRLTETFQRLGLSESGARIAARGHGAIGRAVAAKYR